MEVINIYPEFQKQRINKQGLAPIIIRFDFNRNRIGSDPIGHKVKPEFWDPKSKRVISQVGKQKYFNAGLINSILETTLSRHKNFILKRQAFGLPLTKDIIQQYLRSSSSYENFYDFAEKVIAEKTLKDGKCYSEDTKRRYKDEIKRMKQFKPELFFNNITVAFLTSYKLWMQNTFEKRNGGKLEKNSIWKALGFIRLVYNEAIASEIILAEGNPFKTFKVGSFEQDLAKVKYLELAEVEKLENLLLNDPSVPELTQKVGWRFLSMCVSGMRISDAMLLDDYMFNDKGDLAFTPHKTRRHENTAKIAINTERQKRYFEKTLTHKFRNMDAKSFRSTFNIHLKILAAKLGLQINLTSHVGRHTMGGFLVDGGVEDKAAMAMLGIKSNKVIRGYMHLKESKFIEEANKLKNVF